MTGWMHSLAMARSVFTEQTRKGFLRIRGGRGEVALAGGGDVSVELLIGFERSTIPSEKRFAAQARELPDGLYELKQVATGGKAVFNIGKRVEAGQAISDLQARVQGSGTATTGAPGITGFAQRAAASGAAQKNRIREASRLLDFLRA